MNGGVCPEDRESFIRGLLWTIRVRWVIATFPYLIFLRTGQIEGIHFGFGYGLIPWIEYFFNGIYYILVKKRRCLYFIAYFQLIVDLIAVTLGVHLAGGLASWFGILIYPIIITVASILISIRAGFLMAGIASLLYTGLIAFEYLGIVPRVPILGLEISLYENLPYVITSVVTRIVFFFWISIIAGYLSQEIRKRKDELARSYKRLKETQDQLVQSAKLATIGQMAAGIAHELRNPLNVINSAAYYIKSKIGEDPKLQRNIEHMEREIGRADALITSLLEFSKPVTKIEQVKVNRLLDDALLLLGKEVSFHNIEIVKEYDGALPSIEGERNRLESVFLNIILNAVQAMPDGGRLSLKTRRAGEESIEILFADTGTGIEKEDLHKIFDPFFSRKEKGVGLGLSISAQAIRAHGGEISVESRPGEGTTFSIRLPIKKEG